MSVVAKFFVTSKEAGVYGYYAPGDNIELSVVIGMEPHEDASFFNSTPTGNIKLYCVNPKANAQFEVGKKYYVTFTEATD